MRPDQRRGVRRRSSGAATGGPRSTAACAGYATATRTRSASGYPDIPRRVSGYNLDSLLPEHGFDVAGLLVGSESTLVTVLRAELKLVPVQAERSLVVLGYPSIDKAADAVPAILPHQPIALEGLDDRLIHDEQIKHMNAKALQELPKGTGYLMVQFGGDSREEVDQAAHADAGRAARHRARPGRQVPRRAGARGRAVAGPGGRASARPRTCPASRTPSRAGRTRRSGRSALGDYLRDLNKLYDEFGYSSDLMPSLYGHFGQGCVHTRIPFDLYTAEGVATYRRFMERAADLVVAHGGSLSGEHGDGQSRGELLARMFGPELVHAFEEAQGDLRPGQQDEPRQGRPPRPARPAPAAGRRLGARPRRRICSSATRTTAGRSRRPPTAASASGSAASTRTKAAR